MDNTYARGRNYEFSVIIDRRATTKDYIPDIPKIALNVGALVPKAIRNILD